jgi:ferredoxin-NADP reductase
MVTPTYTVVCTKNQQVAEGVYEMSFTKPEGFTFKAGQFVLFDVALLENPSDIQTRALSIASRPEESELLFVAKMSLGGRISRWIEEKLVIGTEAVIKGPFGFFTLKDEGDRELLWIATSTGIAPFRSMLAEALQKNPRRRIDLIFGARNEEHLFWKEELEQRTQQHENFFLHIALSAPSSSWKGHKGRVQTLVPLIIRDFTNKDVYVCGSPEMTKELKLLCLNDWGVDKKNLHVEGYI